MKMSQAQTALDRFATEVAGSPTLEKPKPKQTNKSKMDNITFCVGAHIY